MGNVSSRLDTQAALYVRDQNRLTFSSVSVDSPRKRSTLRLMPNAFPASKVTITRPSGDSTPIDFVQDPLETPNNSNQIAPFLLKLSSEDELVFTFHFVVRQTEDVNQNLIDSNIAGLTFVHGSTPKEVENLVTSEFNANPNLHKMPNVKLLGDYSTEGSKAVTFEWSWTWRPPKAMDKCLAGWRNTCSFVEYDPRAHRLETLISFSFWVANVTQPLSQPTSPMPIHIGVPPSSAPKLRLVSSQTVDSVHNSDTRDEPTSPITTQFEATPSSSSTTIPQTLHQTVSATLAPPVKIDVACPKPEADLDANDGPVFRATMKALEQKTGNMRAHMKKVLKTAEYAHSTQQEAINAFETFIETLRSASSTNANAVEPAIKHYFDHMAKEILSYEKRNADYLRLYIIDPITKLYVSDIKQAESKKRDFEDESKDYYAYVSRYLGQRQDSVKAKKLVESDNKYQNKRKLFELKRFDYSSFMQDLHGGRKEQEVLSRLTTYAQKQTSKFIETAKAIESMMPELDALQTEVNQANKEYELQRREREEKRRALEKGGPEAEAAFLSNNAFVPPPSSNGQQSESELNRADSTGSQLRGTLGPSASSETAGLASPASSSKFRGIRDLEERNHMMASASSSPGQPASHRKEGLVWALSRPNGHVDPRAALKQQGWHKFWLVLDQGKLQEYSNWKEKLDLHMEPIDLRTASVREARNAERRFCFEVITPNMRRVYQATSEDDMSSWIASINNALQSAMEGRGLRDMKPPAAASEPSSLKRDIGKILTGKSGSLHGHHGNQTFSNAASLPMRRTTVGGRPSTAHTTASNPDENPDRLLPMLRENDQGNNWCADCGSGVKVEWVSINLAIILCIECSGIHRSLGTHISKVRSLTLDITSFTPDIIELLMQVGNRVSNMVWEAKLDLSIKPNPQATREQRLRFITAKYVNREFVVPISPTLSRYATADETLLAAVKKNDIQQVIYALALRANPNATDRSRGTPVVFLALAAADPAPPSPSLSPTPSAESEKCVTFPVAEVLLQNGAQVPSGAPAFPLSRAAQAYIEAKRGRQNLSASNSDAFPIPMLTSSSSTLDRMQRDKEARLQKRHPDDVNVAFEVGSGSHLSEPTGHYDIHKETVLYSPVPREFDGGHATNHLEHCPLRHGLSRSSQLVEESCEDWAAVRGRSVLQSSTFSDGRLGLEFQPVSLVDDSLLETPSIGEMFSSSLRKRSPPNFRPRIRHPSITLALSRRKRNGETAGSDLPSSTGGFFFCSSQPDSNIPFALDGTARPHSETYSDGSSGILFAHYPATPPKPRRSRSIHRRFFSSVPAEGSRSEQLTPSWRPAPSLPELQLSIPSLSESDYMDLRNMFRRSSESPLKSLSPPQALAAMVKRRSRPPSPLRFGDGSKEDLRGEGHE